MPIGDRIKEARLARRLSQQDLAALLGITQGAVGQYERGDNLPSLNLAAALARELLVTTDWLLELDSNALAEAAKRVKRLSELALLSRLAAAFDQGAISENQVALLGGLVDEFTKANRAQASAS